MTFPAWLRATLLLTLALAVGVTLGATYERHRVSVSDSAGSHAEHMFQHLSRDLDLDSAQRDAVLEIFTRRQEAIDSTWRAVQPHVHATLDSTLREVAGVLRPEQLAKFRRMIEEHHAGTLDSLGALHPHR